MRKHEDQSLSRSIDDARRVMHAVSCKILPMIHRRLNEYERANIKTGHVYVYKETTARTSGGIGIERWTDSYRWKASVNKEDFLYYTEDREYLNRPQPFSRLRRAIIQSPRTGGSYTFIITSSPLVKQTFTARVQLDDSPVVEKWHLIAYYAEEDQDKLDTVDTRQALKSLVVPPENYTPARKSRSTFASRTSSNQRKRKVAPIAPAPISLTASTMPGASSDRSMPSSELRDCSPSIPPLPFVALSSHADNQYPSLPEANAPPPLEYAIYPSQVNPSSLPLANVPMQSQPAYDSPSSATSTTCYSPTPPPPEPEYDSAACGTYDHNNFFMPNILRSCPPTQLIGRTLPSPEFNAALTQSYRDGYYCYAFPGMPDPRIVVMPMTRNEVDEEYLTTLNNTQQPDDNVIYDVNSYSNYGFTKSPAYGDSACTISDNFVGQVRSSASNANIYTNGNSAFYGNA
ncbi:hypothetical protein FISHEDRAFT_61820 [Fistulina hepatica ATCC 64428]|uniref:Uncharacterized protein n=1 Tax=Fistulina hepatica ATCC 64428 TaxID=1128425 RepID=A0A0D7A165_9AGAR|nr:hypothetical protein FISHEDRAFT_61820 [Fistulina hepatica ATCC 64428]